MRVVLGEPKRLRIWPKIQHSVSSDLIRLECLRTIDRARIQQRLAEEAVAGYREAVLQMIDDFSLISLDSDVLERAADPFPTMLGALDAIHLATALAARDRFEDLALATHDDELALAGRAMGFRVHGASHQN